MKKLLLLIFILLPLTTFGADTYTLLEPLPAIDGTGQANCEPNNGMICKIDTQTYLSYVYKFAIAFAAVAAVVMIMYAGFEYATTDIIGTKSAAKARIYNALMGLATMLASYLILQTIDPRLVQVETTLPEVKVVGKTFDYNQLVMTSTDYKIRQDLDKVRQDAQVLEKEAAALRKKADETQDEDESVRLREQALVLQRRADFIRHEGTAEAQYDLSKNIFHEISEKPPTGQLKTALDKRKKEMTDSITENIQLMINSGDVEGAQKLEEVRNMTTSRFDQAVFLLPKANMAVLIGKTQVVDSYVVRDVGAIITEINNYTYPGNLSAESVRILESDRQEVLAALNKIVQDNSPAPTPTTPPTP